MSIREPFEGAKNKNHQDPFPKHRTKSILLANVDKYTTPTMEDDKR